MGRKRFDALTMQDWEKPERLAMLEEWAASGFILDEIAKNMGIARYTLYQWRKASPVITAALKRGEESIIDRVEHALIDSAIEDRNITAMIFYLKNKRPNDWKDKRENEISGNGEMRLSWRSPAKNEEKKND